MVFATVTAQEAATQGFVVPPRRTAASEVTADGPTVVCVYMLVNLSGDDACSNDAGPGSKTSGHVEEAEEAQQIEALVARIDLIMGHQGAFMRGREGVLAEHVIAPTLRHFHR